MKNVDVITSAILLRNECNWKWKCQWKNIKWQIKA